MKNDNGFTYTYSAPTENERREIEDIRRRYGGESPQESDMAKLRALDKKVKSTATAWSIVLGVIGLLIFGLGMTLTLEWSQIVWGVVVSIVGCVPMGFAYPLYKYVFNKNKQKYGKEIVKLSDKLLNGGKTEQRGSVKFI